MYIKNSIILIAVCYIILCKGQENCPERDLSQLEPGRSCRKSCVNDSECRGGNKRCICDNVCGLSCFNPESKCLDLEPFLNGIIRPANRTNRYGEAVTYNCNRNFLLQGSSRRTCQSDRNWSGTAPNCTSGCPIPQPTSSSFPSGRKDFYLVGESIEWRCRFGYESRGNGNVTCQENHFFSQSRLMCTKQSCSDPTGRVQFGTIEGDSFDFGSRINIRCNGGYELQTEPSTSQEFSSCASREGVVQWIPPISVFSCEPLVCRPPVNPQFGNVRTIGNSFIFNDQVTYSCQNGYRLEGNTTGRCNEDANWGKVPVCEIDDDCNFESIQRPICGFTATRWSRTRYFDSITSRFLGNILRVSLLRGETQNATFISPTLPSNDTTCLRFYYRVIELGSGSDFSVNLIDENNQRSQLWVFNNRGQRNVWNFAEIFIDDVDDSFRFEFEVTQSNLQPSEVDLDNITNVVEGQGNCSGECIIDPCENEGICINRNGGYECACARGYIGRNCSIVNQCIENPCENGANCTNQNESYECNCAPGYIGKNCSNVDQCNPNPCENGANCTNRNGSYECNCALGYVGRNCSTEIIYMGNWNNWNSWNTCSVTCGKGFQRRERSCFANACNGSSEEFRDCNQENCPLQIITWNNWNSWSACSETCEKGFQIRKRTCSESFANACNGTSEESRDCTQETCPIEITFGEKLYRLFQNPESYDKAFSICKNLGGALPVISSLNINKALKKLLRRRTRDSPLNQYFIGLKKNREGKFVWNDGTFIQFENWAFREPNNFLSREDCATIRYNQGFWNDIPCWYELYFICEVNFCPIPSEIPQFTTVSPVSGSILLGKNITYRCQEKYSLPGTKNTEINATCMSTGKWNLEPPVCEN